MAVVGILFVKSVFLVLTERWCTSIFVSMVNVTFGWRKLVQRSGEGPGSDL